MTDTLNRFGADVALSTVGTQVGTTTGNTTLSILLGFGLPLLKEIIFRLIDKKKAKKQKKQEA